MDFVCLDWLPTCVLLPQIKHALKVHFFFFFFFTMLLLDCFNVLLNLNMVSNGLLSRLREWGCSVQRRQILENALWSAETFSSTYEDEGGKGSGGIYNHLSEAEPVSATLHLFKGHQWFLQVELMASRTFPWIGWSVTEGLFMSRLLLSALPSEPTAHFGRH